MTITLKFLAPTPNQPYLLQDGTTVTSDANSVISLVITSTGYNDVTSLLNQGCLSLGQTGTKSNLAATAAPTVSNDNTQDYGVGSRWIDVTHNTEYTCISAATGAAVWIQGGNNYYLRKTGTFVVNGATPVTITDAGYAITDLVVVSLNTVGGTVGAIPRVVASTAGTSFNVNGVASDTSTYNYGVWSKLN